MAKTEKTVSWESVVDVISADSGMPKKQIDDTSKQIVKGIEKVLEDKQPKKDGDVLHVETPFDLYTATRVPEQVIKDPSGASYTRPPAIAVNTSVPKNFVTAANMGLVSVGDVEKLTNKAS